MKFRFKPEDFKPHDYFADNGYLEAFVDAANSLLEAEEKRCERVYADCRPVHRNWGDEVEYPETVRGKFTITALLWNVEEVGG